MRHRMGIGALTGLGNPSKALLNNTGTMHGSIKDMLDEAIDLYFKKWGGCDYEIGESAVMLGIEPAYQFENLKIICLRRKKENSYLRTGRAFESWGSGIRSTHRFYGDYKIRGKFKKFVNKWHPRIFQLKKA